jgi:hypothetical protein
MTSDDTANLPLACSLSPDELRERSLENGELFARIQNAEELADGYRYTFPAGDAAELLAFILAERDCCPFFTFELTFPSPHQAIQLAIRGREGVKEIVQSSVASGSHTQME